ncbi:putative uncharacterized protein DDB_G0267716 [Ctenocephalides felis]|uniref:putative uncharacterized protein DDB_G0267716 n=1 Tax=Ctenocephalides felis TaxID=7515 RepID=UPI000E6E42B3|nr:putative uncharacterized protein DDB_G0267716 [Ctenocephalides felis]
MDSGPYGEGPDDDREQIQLGPCIGNALRICYGEDMETESNANLNKLNSDVTPKGTINSVQESDVVSNNEMNTITNLETTRGKNSASEYLTGDKPSQETINNNECRSSVRCGHCSGNHNYKECDNREEEPKCALCGNGHQEIMEFNNASYNEAKRILENRPYANIITTRLDLQNKKVFPDIQDHQQRTRDKEPENTEVNQPKKRRLHNTSVETPAIDNSIKNSNNNNKTENDARKASPNINKIPFKKNENVNTKMTKEDNRDKTKEKDVRTTNIQKRGIQPNPSTPEQISLNHIIKRLKDVFNPTNQKNNQVLMAIINRMERDQINLTNPK